MIFAIVSYAAGGVLSVVRFWTERHHIERLCRIMLGLGIVASLGVIVWHAAKRGTWVPLGDNFDMLLWLATLLSIFTLYVHHNRPLGGLDWFVMPVVLALLIASLFVGQRDYRLKDVWGWVHYVSAIGGVLAFAIAAASGALYVLTSRRLRNKSPVSPFFSSLERLEHLTMRTVTFGFAMLTLSMITGGVQLLGEGRKTPVAKIVLAVAVWVIYAIVLHAPINPSFRGRKVAVLSMVGFVLMLGVVLTAILMPGGADDRRGKPVRFDLSFDRCSVCYFWD